MQASPPKPLDSFVRQAAVRFTLRCSVSEIGNQGMSARDEIFVCWGFDCTNRSGRNAHGSSPTKRVKPIG